MVSLLVQSLVANQQARGSGSCFEFGDRFNVGSLLVSDPEIVRMVSVATITLLARIASRMHSMA